MQLRELRQLQRQQPTPAIDILSDGYDYLVQVQFNDRIEPLTDARGRHRIFLNLGDAERELRSVGIHQATLSHVTAQDEAVGLAESFASTRMPLSF